MNATFKEERRRYYRLQPAVEPEPQATFEMNGVSFDVKVVNLSPGGLLCYMNGRLTPCTTDSMIDKITIKVPDKKPEVYSGRIVRVMETAESNKKFCAVEFTQYRKKILKKGRKPVSAFQPENSDKDFLERLQSYKSFLLASSLEEELSLRKTMYEGFTEESQKLVMEERWFFYEVLDEMKRSEPDYPDGLKTEFLRLCRAEDRSEFVVKKNEAKGLKGFFKKITGAL